MFHTHYASTQQPKAPAALRQNLARTLTPHTPCTNTLPESPGRTSHSAPPQRLAAPARAGPSTLRTETCPMCRLAQLKNASRSGWQFRNPQQNCGIVAVRHCGQGKSLGCAPRQFMHSSAPDPPATQPAVIMCGLCRASGGHNKLPWAPHPSE